MIKYFFHSEKASTAVEFAIVGIPFVFALVGLIELSLMYAANSVLQDSTTSAARMIRTGQAQQSRGDAESVFQTELCRVASTFLNCNLIQYEVITLDGGFNDAVDSQPTFDENGNLVSSGFSPAGSDQVTMIRTVYLYPLLTPIIGTLMSDRPGQTKFMMSTVVLQTEPYEFNAGG